MSDEFGEQLGNGWWYGTNNSAQETKAWLERACSCAGTLLGRRFQNECRLTPACIVPCSLTRSINVNIPRSDPLCSVAELLGEAEPSRQSAVLHDAWREYAAKAARPYAWKTFALYAREHFTETGDWWLERGKEKLTPWQDGARASPRVLVLGAYAALRVRGGALEIEHGPHDDRQTIRIDIDAEPKPRAILFDSHGEFMTGEAIRWCARYSINLALPGGPGRLITMVESALETKTNTMTRMRDIDPSIIRAQCAADPVRVAREIVQGKDRCGIECDGSRRRSEAASGSRVGQQVELWRAASRRS